MNRKKDEDLLQRLKEVFDSVEPPIPTENYPPKALPVGTYVRSIRLNKLGVVTDAFYGDVDADNQRIIVYTILLFPSNDLVIKTAKTSDEYYITNEYEYEILAYLMIQPANLKKLTAKLSRGLF